jgi:hypothetical protein
VTKIELGRGSAANHRITALWTVGLIGVWVSSCDQAGPEFGRREYRPVSASTRPATEAETREILLTGPRSLFEGLPDAGPERFTASGNYMRSGSPSISGRYSVLKNRFCVSHSYEGELMYCRYMNIGPDGPSFRYDIK